MKDKDYISFVLGNDEVVTFYTDGDCCSESWIEHFSDIKNVIDSKILEITETDMGELAHPDHECLSLYGVKFKTSKGYADLEFRNSSNGYYGGSLENISSTLAGFNEIKEDF